MKINMKRWAEVFRILSNINRLEIIRLLSKGESLPVGEIATHLKISFTATSNHLAMLKSLDVLEAKGSEGHVYYSISKQMPADFKKIINLM
jgi:DNA-binding transcriptional ArsR family regulator